MRPGVGEVVEVPQDLLINLCKWMHNRSQGDRRTRYHGVDFDTQDAEMVHFYVDKVEPTVRLIYDAGMVILPASEVEKAYRPRQKIQIVKPVIRLRHDSGKVELRTTDDLSRR